MVKHQHLIVFLLVASFGLLAGTGCSDIFGSKSDTTTEQIFDEGRIDPSLLEDVGYVAIQPFYEEGLNGPFDHPADVQVGFDDFVYVVDQAGLHVLDLAGRPVSFVSLRGAVSVSQDRRLHVYVAARRDTVISGQTWDLPVVYRFSGLAQGVPRTENILWHPFDDDSRKFARPDPIETDVAVHFTGVSTLHDNRIYVSRRGPVNVRNSSTLPHNAIMEFSPEGINTRTILALHPTVPSLRSAVDPSDVITYFSPPQQSGLVQDDRFLLSQAPDDISDMTFGIVAIRTELTSDGIIYRPDVDVIRASGNPENGDGFLFEGFKFQKPVDLAFAGDGTNYIFVLDAAKDSLFIFTGNGIEGVAPAPGSGRTKPVVVSFGGNGGGALEFNEPQGVTYANKIVYVADTGNGRISRFKLNTDFE
ncbi:hypothetical protein ACFLRO_01605 [Bacteroidota bacterium]